MRPDTPRRCAISSTSAICSGPRRGPPDGQEAQSPRPAHEGGANAPGSPGAGLRRARGGDHRHLADPEATGLGAAAERGLPVPAAAQDAQACPPARAAPCPHEEPAPGHGGAARRSHERDVADDAGAGPARRPRRRAARDLAAAGRSVAAGVRTSPGTMPWRTGSQSICPAASSCPRTTIRARAAGRSRRPGQEHRQATGSMPSEPPVGLTRLTATASSCGGADPSWRRDPSPTAGRGPGDCGAADARNLTGCLVCPVQGRKAASSFFASPLIRTGGARFKFLARLDKMARRTAWHRRPIGTTEPTIHLGPSGSLPIHTARPGNINDHHSQARLPG